MVMNFYKRYIRIPPGENIDIRPIMSIVTHPFFQRLLHIYQLGQLYLVFPGATHNRFEHALGVYSKTLRLTKRLTEEGFITEREARAVSAYGLLHDIGHGPLSHLIEDLTSYNHNQNGKNIVTQMIPAIEAAGIDKDLFLEIFNRKNNLYRIVSDKNLGMDKLDYLERDIYHIGFGFKPDIETILSYLSFIDGQLAIDIKSIDAAQQIQQLYMYMYKGVYLKKSSVINERFIRKMISIWMTLDNVNEKDLWSLTDMELMSKIYNHPDDRLKYLYQAWRERNLPKTGLVIKLNKGKVKERIAGKSMKVVERNEEFFEKIGPKLGSNNLSVIEEEIAMKIGVRPESIIVVPNIHPERFIPQDILYHDEGKVISLRSNKKDYFKSLESEVNEHVSIRVCGIANRERIAKYSKDILDILSKYTG